MTDASASVIAFPVDRVRAMSPRDPSSASADVVIFTGIRIERHADEPLDAAPRSRGLTRKGRGQRR